MKARTKFLKMYYELPIRARVELIFDYPISPKTLNVVAIEVLARTKNSLEMLNELGFEDD